jgi:hypothetical protein
MIPLDLVISHHLPHHYSTAPWYRSIGAILLSLPRGLLKRREPDDMGRRAKNAGVVSGADCHAVGSLELRLVYGSV